MNKLLVLILIFFTLNAFGQEDIDKFTKSIVLEGKRLYKSEMASWYGTDIFLEMYKDKQNIGGYFSYVESDSAKCIFFSKSDKPSVIGTVFFDSTYNVLSAKKEIFERNFTKKEQQYFIIRQNALRIISTDTFFKSYQNTSFNLVPLISDTEKKVYVLTGPKDNGVVIFGNDYLLTFDKENKLIESKRLHKNIIPFYYNKETEDAETYHSHLPESDDFITATDICTLMLYEKFAKWKQHTVISENYVNIWNCQTNELVVITRKAFDKIIEDQDSKKKKKE
jgi:hypothetical protein